MIQVVILSEVFRECVPNYILHLATYSSVAYSWKKPGESFQIIQIYHIETVQQYNPNCRILPVGSYEEYGNVEPIRENQVYAPTSPYTLARVSQEMLSKIFVETFDIDIILPHSINYIGPRQDDRFVVPSFIKRILEIKEGGKREGTIETGEISVIRDFVDARDVVRAYYMLLTKGKRVKIILFVQDKRFL